MPAGTKGNTGFTEHRGGAASAWKKQGMPGVFPAEVEEQVSEKSRC